VIDALATIAAWSIVGGIALLVVGWMLWPAILAGAKGIGLRPRLDGVAPPLVV